MPLRLDLLRHGDAEPAGSEGDWYRALTPLGRRDVTGVAEEYERRGWRPDRVLVSPLQRARETAEILLARVGQGMTPETLRALVPDHSAEELAEALAHLDLTGHVVLIGHQPLLGQLADLLLERDGPAFPPGSMAAIELPRGVEAGEGTLVARVLPEELG